MGCLVALSAGTGPRGGVRVADNGVLGVVVVGRAGLGIVRGMVVVDVGLTVASRST